MTPRNKEEREVERLHNSLPAVSVRQINWMASQAKAESASKFAERGKKVSNYFYYGIVTSWRGWQVVRYYMLHNEQSRNGYKFGYLTEISQRWMRMGEDGKIVLHIYERCKTMCWQWKAQPYSLNDNISLKPWNTNWNRNGRALMCLADSEIYPIRRFSEDFSGDLAPLLGRVDEIDMQEEQEKGHSLVRKARGYALALDHHDVVKVGNLMRDLPPMYESLVKMGEQRLASRYLSGSWDGRRVVKYWKPFLCARRHGYKPARWDDWFDYVEDLETLGRDIHSPKYICPADLGTAHAEVLNEIERRRERARAEFVRKQEEEQMKKAQGLKEEFIKARRSFLDIALMNKAKDIIIKPLQSVEEFMTEGRAMHHCVFRMGYYDVKKFPNSLILSARDKDGNRLETIEVNLATYKIEQSRGVCNKPSPKHDAIVSLVNRNMDVIRAHNFA